MEIEINDSTLELTQGDITKQNTEAIVNAANKRLAPGGGVAGAIHKAAGPELWEECQELGGCATGEAKITNGYNLPAKYVIHTVGTVFSGEQEDQKLLSACYRESIKLAEEKNIDSISFPAISTGAFGYPMEKAAKVALNTIIDYLKTSKISLVRLVLYDSKALKIHEDVLREMKKIDEELQK